MIAQLPEMVTHGPEANNLLAAAAACRRRWPARSLTAARAPGRLGRRLLLWRDGWASAVGGRLHLLLFGVAQTAGVAERLGTERPLSRCGDAEDGSQ